MKILLHIITLSLVSLSISYAEMNCYVFTDKDERAECERMNIRESMSLSQTTKKKEKRWFLGIDGGIGLLIPTKMIFLPKEELGITKGISYIAGANFGWQKYGKGRVGSRYTIRLGGLSRERYANKEIYGKLYTIFHNGANDRLYKKRKQAFWYVFRRY